MKLILDPVAQQFLDELSKQAVRPIYQLSPVDARDVLLTAQRSISVTKLPADIEDRTLPIGPNGTVNIRIVKPKGNKDVLPAILYMHGGGWVLGDKETHDRLVREIVNKTNAVVVFVDYTRAPEAPFPLAHEEGYAVGKWLSENGKALNIDTSRIAIVGDSVGGGMATSIALMAQERGGPHFVFQVLFYPVTDANFETSSYQQFATGYFLERDGMKWFWDNYVPNKAERENHFISPLKTPIERLKSLPPALIINGECDVLCDEGQAYARKLMQAGVKTIAVEYVGMIHDFVMLNPLAYSEQTKAAIEQACDTLKRVFY